MITYSSITRLATALVATLWVPAARAQFPTDGWAWTGVFTAVEILDANFQYIILASGANGHMGIAADQDGGSIVYVSNPVVGAYRYDPSGSPPLFGLMGLNTLADPAWSLETSREYVYFFDLIHGNLNRCRKGVASQTGILLANPSVQAGISGTVCDVCGNGRELFFSVDVTGSDTHHIFAIDLQDSVHPVRSIASLSVGTTPRCGPSLAIGPDGDILAMDDPYLYRIDPQNGALTQIATKPSSSAFAAGWFAPGGGWRILMDYDPWTDLVAVAPKDQTWMLFGSSMVIYVRSLVGSSIPSWQFAFGSPGIGGHGLTSLAIRPFELFGMGCRNGMGLDPRLGWRGLPKQGQSFSTTLRDAEPNGFAFFWLGLSDTVWAPLGTLPFDAAPFGAPGCLVRVSPDVPFPVPVDGNGCAVLSHAVPVNPALSGMQLFTQTASSSTANAMGFAASDAMIIRIR